MASTSRLARRSPWSGRAIPTTATCTTTALPIGHPDSITAFYAGDATTSPSDNTASPFSQYVDLAASSASVSVDINPAVSGQASDLFRDGGGCCPGCRHAFGIGHVSPAMARRSPTARSTPNQFPWRRVSRTARRTPNSPSGVPHSVTVSLPGRCRLPREHLAGRQSARCARRNHHRSDEQRESDAVPAADNADGDGIRE